MRPPGPGELIACPVLTLLSSNSRARHDARQAAVDGELAPDGEAARARNPARTRAWSSASSTRVRVVHGGKALLSPTVTRRLIEEFASRAKPPRPDRDLARLLGLLTDREREVLTHVAAGLSNDEITRVLVVSPATAKTHVSRVMTKPGVRARAQLVVIGYESGLVRPGWMG